MPIKKIALLFAVMAFLAAASIFYIVHPSRNTPVVRIIKECSPSVVNISTERIVSLQGHPYWGQYSGSLDKFVGLYQNIAVGAQKLNGVGSGVILSEDGLIVTNAHVINMASRVYVILSDGKACEASLEAINPKMDLAIIKITSPEQLKPIRLAKDVIIGETVISIGNPFGLQNSVSAGIISGINRNFSTANGQDSITGLIQTDASINQGSSGGALLNLDGELVGISFAIVQNAQSIGFAIPAEKVRVILKDLRNVRAKQALKVK